MIKNFRYEDEGRVALSGFPANTEDVDWLYEQGIRTIVSLHPVPEAAQGQMVERGIVWEPFVIPDVVEPFPGSLRALFERMQLRAEAEPAVLIHCQGGGGRSGAIYAAWLLYQGETLENVLARVPGVEKDVQRAFLNGFAAAL